LEWAKYKFLGKNQKFYKN